MTVNIRLDGSDSKGHALKRVEGKSKLKWAAAWPKEGLQGQEESEMVQDGRPMVSVVIPTFNRKEELRECLESLQKISYPGYEVIVVDDASQDDTESMIHQLFPSVRYYKNTYQKGVACTKNKGVKEAKGEYIWFLDSDTVIVDGESLSNGISIIQLNPKVGSIGGELIEAEGRMMMRIYTHYINGDGHYKLFDRDAVGYIECKFLATANCLVKKELLFELGGFNPCYFFTFEDCELGKKLRKMGYINVTTNKTLVYHKHSMKSRISTLRLLQKNRVRYVILNEHWIVILFLPFIDAVSAIMLLPSRIKELRHKKETQILYLSDKAANKGNSLLIKLVKLAYLSCLSLIYSYAWNLWKLPTTLSLRWKPPNFMDEQT